MKHLLMLSTLFAAVAMWAVPSPTQPQCSIHPAKGAKQADLAKLAKITQSEAQKLALAVLPDAKGATVAEAELEAEDGCLIWSFDLKLPGKKGVQEVQIDAGDGKVLVSEYETPKKESQEKAGEKKGKVELPASVAKAVKDHFPTAEIRDIEMENEAGLAMYDIEFEGETSEMEVAGDGTVMDISTKVEMKDLPKPAADAIQKAANTAKGKIKKIEISEISAKVQKQGEKELIVKLATPKTVYEAMIVTDNQQGEIAVSPDGRIVEELKWWTKGEDKD